MEPHWTLTYNLIWCVITIPLLGFLGRYMLKNLERKIADLCDGMEKKRSKDMCDEKHKAVTGEEAALAKSLNELWDRVNHHRHQKDNGGVVL